MWVSTSRNHTRTQEVSQVLQKTMSLKILHGPAAHQTHSRWANEMQRIHWKIQAEWCQAHGACFVREWSLADKNQSNRRLRMNWAHPRNSQSIEKYNANTLCGRRHNETKLMKSLRIPIKVMLHKRSFAIFLRKCTVNPATDYNIFSGRTWTNLWRDLKLLISIS